VTDSDGAAIYDGATVDSNDAAVQAVIRGTNAGGYIEYGGVTLEVNTGEFTNRLRLSDGTDETIVDGAAPTAGEWANVELIADGGDLEATIWPVGTDKPNSSDIELTGVDATGDLEVSTVNTDDVLTVDEVSVQPYSTLGSQTVSGRSPTSTTSLYRTRPYRRSASHRAHSVATTWKPRPTHSSMNYPTRSRTRSTPTPTSATSTRTRTAPMPRSTRRARGTSAASVSDRTRSRRPSRRVSTRPTWFSRPTSN